MNLRHPFTDGDLLRAFFLADPALDTLVGPFFGFKKLPVSETHSGLIIIGHAGIVQSENPGDGDPVWAG
jgi:hypothetical protein